MQLGCTASFSNINTQKGTRRDTLIDGMYNAMYKNQRKKPTTDF